LCPPNSSGFPSAARGWRGGGDVTANASDLRELQTADRSSRPWPRSKRMTPRPRRCHRCGSGPRRGRELLEQVLSAGELFHRGKHYVVQDGAIAIADEST
jgi:glycine/D-amino acid oxidase-like deaminating enzyme